MERINFMEIFSKNKTTAIIAECWNEGLSAEVAIAMVKLNDLHYTELMVYSIYLLLEEQEPQEQEKFELSQI